MRKHISTEERLDRIEARLDALIALIAAEKAAQESRVVRGLWKIARLAGLMLVAFREKLLELFWPV